MYIHETGSPSLPAILFLHANGADGTMWRPHMECLPGYHCLAVDFPGYGRSNQEEWISLDDTANRLIEIINTRANGRAHIVGLSLGGSTGITLLSKAPELIDHAIIDGAGVLPLPGVTLQKIGFPLVQPLLHTEFFIKLMAGMMKMPPENYAGFRSTMRAMSPSSFTRSFLQALSQRQPPSLEKAACPVLFVAGEKEPQAVRDSNTMLAKLLPHAAARIAPGMGHGWLAENPELHVQMVSAWISDTTLPGVLKVTD